MTPDHSNTGAALPITDDQATHSFAKDQLKAIVERIERVGETIKEAQDDQKEIYSEAKANGYDLKALRAIVRMRKEDANKRSEHETIVETYKDALGML